MLPSTPRISIGLPVCNGEKYLAQTIESILNQTFSDFELIIADNASDDSTQGICHAYADVDERIRYQRNDRQRNERENRNQVFRQAVGTYFQWGAQGDLLAPTALSTCCEVLDCDPTIVLASPRTLLINDADKPIGASAAGLHLLAAHPGDRLRQILAKPNVDRALYGLICSDILQKTALLSQAPQPERLLLTALSLHGKLVEVPEALLSQRISARNILPSVSQPPPLGWRQIYATLRLIQRANLSIAERTHCYVKLAHFSLVSLREQPKMSVPQPISPHLFWPNQPRSGG